MTTVIVSAPHLPLVVQRYTLPAVVVAERRISLESEGEAVRQNKRTRTKN